MFISTLNAVVNDQAFSDQDAYAVNAPNQFRVVGPYSTSVEGLPITTTRNGGVVISPGLVLVGVGVALALFWKKL